MIEEGKCRQSQPGNALGAPPGLRDSPKSIVVTVFCPVRPTSKVRHNPCSVATTAAARRGSLQNRSRTGTPFSKLDAGEAQDVVLSRAEANSELVKLRKTGRITSKVRIGFHTQSFSKGQE